MLSWIDRVRTYMQLTADSNEAFIEPCWSKQINCDLEAIGTYGFMKYHSIIRFFVSSQSFHVICSFRMIRRDDTAVLAGEDHLVFHLSTRLACRPASSLDARLTCDS